MSRNKFCLDRRARFPLGIHREGRWHRKRPDRATGYLQRALWRSVHVAFARCVCSAARRENRCAPGQRLAPQYRMEWRSLWHRSSDGHRSYTRHGACGSCGRSLPGANSTRPDLRRRRSHVVPGSPHRGPRPASHMVRSKSLRRAGPPPGRTLCRQPSKLWRYHIGRYSGSWAACAVKSLSAMPQS